MNQMIEVKKQHALFDKSGQFKGLTQTSESAFESYAVMQNLRVVEITEEIRLMLLENPEDFYLNDEDVITPGASLTPIFPNEAVADGVTPYLIDNLPAGLRIILWKDDKLMGVTSISGTSISLTFSEPGSYGITINGSHLYKRFQKEIHVV